MYVSFKRGKHTDGYNVKRLIEQFMTFQKSRKTQNIKKIGHNFFDF
jgi:hypothetical protein